MRSHLLTTLASDLYGVVTDSLDRARTMVEETLDIQMEARDSHYLGPYYLAKNGDERLTLRINYDSHEREWAEPEFEDTPYLLYVELTRRHQEVGKSLLQSDRIRLLRHEVIDESAG